ncbi:MAG: hypothetical protein R2932_45345 [Caldilineaceae bacterium]
MTLRRVLIPLNISEISSEILPVVRRLFTIDDVELTLLGVTQRPKSYVAADAGVSEILMPPIRSVVAMKSGGPIARSLKWN